MWTFAPNSVISLYSQPTDMDCELSIKILLGSENVDFHSGMGFDIIVPLNLQLFVPSVSSIWSVVQSKGSFVLRASKRNSFLYSYCTMFYFLSWSLSHIFQYLKRSTLTYGTLNKRFVAWYKPHCFVYLFQVHYSLRQTNLGGLIILRVDISGSFFIHPLFKVYSSLESISLYFRICVLAAINQSVLVLIAYVVVVKPLFFNCLLRTWSL